MLGWREVPVNEAACGVSARAVAPRIAQLFVGAGEDVADQDAFERKLYVIRRAVEHEDLDELAIPSFSSRTMVLKGMLTAPQLPRYFPDLRDERVVSRLALVHSRFSTNTFPSWELAHPYRMLAHNGEINTLRGNRNWMRARELQLASPLFGDDIEKILPLLRDDISDSASLDGLMELLVLGGRSAAHAISMLIPEAHRGRPELPQEVRDFYAYHSSLVEPWDGPAAVAFSDGRVIGATLDRNGLRPGRWLVTRDGWVVFASETGVLEVPADEVASKGRLLPGKLFLVDLESDQVVPDGELKLELAQAAPLRALARRAGRAHRGPAREDTARAARGAAARQAARLRLDRGGPARDARADGARRHRAHRLDGQRRGPGRALRHAPAAVLLLQAAVRAGHEPGDRPDPRVDRDEPRGRDRPGDQPARRDARPLPPARDAAAAAAKHRAREAPPGGPQRVRGAHDRHDLARRAGRAGDGAAARGDLRRGLRADRARREHHRALGQKPRRRAGPDARDARHRSRAQPPRPRGHAPAKRPDRRDRPGQGDPPRGLPDRLRGRRREPLRDVRVALRAPSRGAPGRGHAAGRGGEPHHQGRGQGAPEDPLQDGDLHDPLLHRRADLRGGRHREGARGPPLHRHALARGRRGDERLGLGVPRPARTRVPRGEL